MTLLLFYTLAVFAADDSDTSSDSSENWEISILNRDTNSLGIKVLKTDISKFSRQDCLDDVAMDFQISLLNSAKELNKTVYLYAGEECNTNTGIADCIKIDQGYTSTGKITFTNISLSSIFDQINCDANNTESLQLWIAMLDTEDVIDRDSDDLVGRAILLKLKTSAPSATVKNVTYNVGDGSIRVSWDKIDDGSVKGYAVFYAKGSDTTCSEGVLKENEPVNADKIDGSESSFSNAKATSLTVSGLDNGGSYEMSVTTLDEYGNSSNLSEVVCASPVPTEGIGSALQADSGYCFIATAAFGSYNHPTVKELRLFRDQFLALLPFGNSIISAYYSAGPSMAAVINHHSELKSIVVSALSLFAGFSTLLVAFGPFWFISVIMISILAGLILGFTFMGSWSKK